MPPDTSPYSAYDAPHSSGVASLRRNRAAHATHRREEGSPDLLHEQLRAEVAARLAVEARFERSVEDAVRARHALVADFQRQTDHMREEHATALALLRKECQELRDQMGGQRRASSDAFAEERQVLAVQHKAHTASMEMEMSGLRREVERVTSESVTSQRHLAEAQQQLHMVQAAVKEHRRQLVADEAVKTKANEVLKSMLEANTRLENSYTALLEEKDTVVSKLQASIQALQLQEKLIGDLDAERVAMVQRCDELMVELRMSQGLPRPLLMELPPPQPQPQPQPQLKPHPAPLLSQPRSQRQLLHGNHGLKSDPDCATIETDAAGGVGDGGRNNQPCGGRSSHKRAPTATSSDSAAEEGGSEYSRSRRGSKAAVGAAGRTEPIELRGPKALCELLESQIESNRVFL